MLQTRCLRRKSYHILRIDEFDYPKIVYERLEKLKLYDQLRSEGCCEKTALKAIGVQRAKFYRLKRKYAAEGLSGLAPGNRRPHNMRKPEERAELKKLVLQLRTENPLWGKAPIRAVIGRDFGIKASESTVGRILKSLVATGKVRPVRFYQGKIRITKKRTFLLDHVHRWRYGMKATRPGELVQVDHSYIQLSDGTWIRHFEAICPITKLVVHQAYHRATSAVAANFLQYAISKFPFEIKSLQVDGGSEFMGEFETACGGAHIHLFVLPPKRPQYNGAVERVHATSKYEFYYQYAGPSSLAALRPALARYNHRYNTYRPHQALHYLTPWCYYQSTWEAQMSHMS